MMRTCGVGLNNKDAAKKCRNICYINSIIQCLANTAPFVQWLLNNDLHGKCKYSIK
jgi:ubiquitin C-terminal hydrolase